MDQDVQGITQAWMNLHKTTVWIRSCKASPRLGPAQEHWVDQVLQGITQAWQVVPHLMNLQKPTEWKVDCKASATAGTACTNMHTIVSKYFGVLRPVNHYGYIRAIHRNEVRYKEKYDTKRSTIQNEVRYKAKYHTKRSTIQNEDDTKRSTIQNEAR